MAQTSQINLVIRVCCHLQEKTEFTSHEGSILKWKKHFWPSTLEHPLGGHVCAFQISALLRRCITQIFQATSPSWDLNHQPSEIVPFKGTNHYTTVLQEFQLQMFKILLPVSFFLTLCQNKASFLRAHALRPRELHLPRCSHNALFTPGSVIV